MRLNLLLVIRGVGLLLLLLSSLLIDLVLAILNVFLLFEILLLNAAVGRVWVINSLPIVVLLLFLLSQLRLASSYFAFLTGLRVPVVLTG